MQKLFRFFLAAVLLLGLTPPQPVSAQSPNASRLEALNYAQWQVFIQSAPSTSGSGTSFTVSPGLVNTAGGQSFIPFNIFVPVTINPGFANSETLTPTAVSGCGSSVVSPASCTLTFTTSNVHGAGEPIISGTFGLAEAAYAAFQSGGGLVSAGANWSMRGGTSAMINALVPFPAVAVEDSRSGVPQFWTPQPSAVTAITAPIALVAQAACDSTHYFCSDATVAGSASWGGSVYGCIAFVDIMGNESACSPTSTVFTSVASKAIDIGFAGGKGPAATAGAVGYTIYLSLSGGTYALAYQIPITGAVCTLTTLETVTPACAVTNSIYGQTGSNAQFTGYPVNTSPGKCVALGIITLLAQGCEGGARISYAYAPGSHIGLPAMASSFLPFGTNSSTATTVPTVLGSLWVPQGFLNYIGKSVRISGKIALSQPGSTSENFGLVYDAPVSDALSVPVQLCNWTETATGPAGSQVLYFSCTLTTNATGATGTVAAAGFLSTNLAAATTAGNVYNTPDTATAVSATANLAGTAGFSHRISFICVPVGSTQTSSTLLAMNLEVLN